MFQKQASNEIKKGQLVEKGLIRRVETDGNQNPYLFTWSTDRSVMGFGSGCATFYNTSLEPNTSMERDFVNDNYTITALRDIKKGEELTHTYKSLQWREAFQDLNETLQQQSMASSGINERD